MRVGLSLQGVIGVGEPGKWREETECSRHLKFPSRELKMVQYGMGREEEDEAEKRRRGQKDLTHSATEFEFCVRGGGNHEIFSEGGT